MHITMHKILAAHKRKDTTVRSLLYYISQLLFIEVLISSGKVPQTTYETYLKP